MQFQFYKKVTYTKICINNMVLLLCMWVYIIYIRYKVTSTYEYKKNKHACTYLVGTYLCTTYVFCILKYCQSNTTLNFMLYYTECST